MNKARWYWHRLRAMGPGEVAAHLGRRVYQWQDARQRPDGSGLCLGSAASFPRLPSAEAASTVLREALARDARDILAGRWKAFGHLEIQVDEPPRWHKDYLAGLDLATDAIAFRLDHRELPGGADIKLIWELSRWYQLVRLAMAAYVLEDRKAAEACLRWLCDWVKHNPPYRGWNWTSALEVGLRLVQFVWMDALLRSAPTLGVAAPGPTKPCSNSVSADTVDAAAGGRPALQTRLDSLAREILPAHVRYAWRYRSVGSSANNHLIGELTGLILAVTRWPELAQYAAPLEALQGLWEREVLAQFAEDGGNREQALNYHLFSWEFCWQTRGALQAEGRAISSTVEERLQRAARFFWEVQVRREPWDYGDSDNAQVTPFFMRAETALIEWRDWLSRGNSNGAARDYWLGDPPKFQPPLGRGAPIHTTSIHDWWIYPTTGMAICESGFWWLRWDLSPLGYLRTAAHGHLDALHLSIWHGGVALVVDPGTGAYYADTELRTWLASSEAHNGPSPKSSSVPVRLGPFLWSAHHDRPRWKWARQNQIAGERDMPHGTMRRVIVRMEDRDGWRVEDTCQSRAGTSDFTVRWQFAPGCFVKRLGERRFRVCRDRAAIELEAGEEWAEVLFVEERNSRAFTTAATTELEAEFAGTVSRAFRKVEWAPFLKLVARPRNDKSCVFRTLFLASPRA